MSNFQGLIPRLLDAVQVGIASQEQRAVGHGGGGFEGAFQLVRRQNLKGAVGGDDGGFALAIAKVNSATNLDG